MPDPNAVERINEELNQACELTQQIIDFAINTDLEDLDNLNNQRLILINKIFDNDKSNINVVLAKKLLVLNEQAMKVIKDQMAINIKKQNSFRKGNKAHNAYMLHSR